MKHVDDIEGAGWTVLTARERDVIHPVAQGKSNKLIAMELGISMRTVEAHRARIFYKMGVRNAVQLAREVCTNPEPAASTRADCVKQHPGHASQLHAQDSAIQT
jgi:DNA-binding CsgD family transcriptional regulator